MISLAGQRAAEQAHRPDALSFEITMDFAEPRTFELLLRAPWWLSGDATVTIDGSPCEIQAEQGFFPIKAAWHRQHITISFPKSLHAE